ncbi:MAG: GtrA family protein [Proteobacteria bacterium]|jgi:putative flippase GtrA|nr:GtrA family protein [Pseudomonadota bacterium]
MSKTLADLLPGILKPFASARFAKFCAVGVSGVAVNAGCLALLTGALGVQTNLAAALAIEISINTNFLVNELWTFRDRREGSGGPWRRWLRYHAVSVVGALIQWSVFVAMNAAVAWILGVDDAGGSAARPGIAAAIAAPADVGLWIYVSQLAGIAVATLWNFAANLFWTWKRGKGAEERA